MKLFGYDINFKAAKIDRSKIGQTVPGYMDKNPNALVHTNYTSMLNAYKSWVYVCSNKNAISFAQQKLKLYVTKQSKNEKLLVKTKSISKETRKYMERNSGIASLDCVRKSVDIEEVTEHRYHDMMKNVNGFMNRFEFMEILDLHQELCGNCFVYIVKDILSVPVEMWLLQPDRVTIVPSRENWIAGYVYRTMDGFEIPFTADEIVHFKFPNPKDQYYGWSPLAAVAESYNIGMSYSKYEQSLMNNGGIPPIALVAPKDVSYDEASWKRILTRWNKTYGGEKNEGKTAWLEGGWDIKQLNVTPREMAYLSGRKMTREEIAAAYGVPISKLTSENVNRANAEAGDYQYLADTIAPRCTRFEERVNEKIIPMFDERLFVMFDDPVPENKEYKLRERESHLKVFLTTINEERKILGLEPVAWGELPVGQQGNVPYDGTKPEPQEQQSSSTDPAQSQSQQFDEEGKVKKPTRKFSFDDEETQAQVHAMILEEVIAEVIAEEVGQ